MRRKATDISPYSHALIDQTIQVWQPVSAMELTESDAAEILDNTVALLDLLAELQEKYGQSQEDV